MMQTMRNSAKIIFFIVLVTFVGFMAYGGVVSLLSGKNRAQGGGAPPGVIGIVNGEQISQFTFDESYRKRMQALTKEDTLTKEIIEPTDAELEQARNDIWNNMTTLALLEQEAKKHGIAVTDAEVADYMRQSPPRDIQQAKDFATDGKFDISKYQMWLQQLAASQDPRAQTIITDFEAQIRQQLLISRLQDFVLSNVRITQDDAKNDFVDKNDKINVQYIFIPGGDYDSTITKVPDEEIKARYEKDQDLFKQPEMAIISYVQMPKTPSEADANSSKLVIDSIYQQLRTSADFATLAKERSEDPGSGKNGGDLGWFGEGRMVKEFWDAASSLKNIGDISAPFRSQFGWHIVKMTGKRMTKGPDGKEKPEYQASHILIKAEASNKTLADIEQKMNNLKADAETNGLKKAAEEYGLTMTESRPFPKGPSVPGVGQNQQLNDFAFKGKPGDISDVVSVRSGFFLIQIERRTPAGIAPYNDIKERLQSTILRERRVDLAHKRGEELVDQMSRGKTFQQIALETGKPILETGLFTRSQFVPKIGSDPDFIGAAFSLSPSKPYSKAVNSRTGSFILKFVEHQPMDANQFTVAADSLTNEMITSKRKDVWSRWISNLKQNAKIEDFRSTYYGS
jgi:parvulin-like peptidyl-prolyl isomerase